MASSTPPPMGHQGILHQEYEGGQGSLLLERDPQPLFKSLLLRCHVTHALFWMVSYPYNDTWLHVGLKGGLSQRRVGADTLCLLDFLHASSADSTPVPALDSKWEPHIHPHSQASRCSSHPASSRASQLFHRESLHSFIREMLSEPSQVSRARIRRQKVKNKLEMVCVFFESA